MSAENSSSSANSAGHPKCWEEVLRGPITAGFALVNIALLLPLSVTVLILGVQRWKQKRSVSFSDFFTYNMAVMELIGVLGSIFTFCGAFTTTVLMPVLGFYIGFFPWSGQMLFPIVTSADRYLAVVHPIIYLRQKQRLGIRIRNITTMMVWFSCLVGMMYLLSMQKNNSYRLVPTICLLAISLLGIIFYNLSVLRVLMRPRPGEAGGNRAGVNQSKRRAFTAIFIIMEVLILRFGGNLAMNVVYFVPSVSTHVQCVIAQFQVLFNLPSSLVLPLLFLYNAGKLQGCRQN